MFGHPGRTYMSTWFCYAKLGETQPHLHHVLLHTLQHIVIALLRAIHKMFSAMFGMCRDIQTRQQREREARRKDTWTLKQISQNLERRGDHRGLLVLTLVSFIFYCSILEILLKKTHAEYVSYSNKVLLGLVTGGWLQRIQRGYKSHPRELPSIRKVGYIHK